MPRQPPMNRKAEALKKEQAGLEKDAQALAEAMKEAGKGSDSPSTAKALEKASEKTAQGSEAAGKASKDLEQGKSAEAGREQQQALDRMEEARGELERLQNSLAQKDAGKFKDPSKQQDAAGKKARELAELGEKIDKRSLERIAEETGGRAFFPKGADELSAIYAAVEDELRAKYLVAYQSTNTRGEPGFRTVELTVERRGVEVKAPRGYYP